MQQYLLNTVKGDLHLIRDSRELEKILPDDRVITVMNIGEFEEKAMLPHKSGLIASIRHHSISRLETFSDCIQGIVRVPYRSSGNLTSQSFGFHLQDDTITFIDDTDFLWKKFQKIERDPLGVCSLTYLLLTVLDLFIADDVAYLDKLEEKLVKMEENLLHRIPTSFYATVIGHRKELARLRAFYEQLMNMGDQIQAAVGHELSPKEAAAWRIFDSRCDRLHGHVAMLADYLLQIRELYQSLIDVQQNQVMTFLTIVTTLFLPLTLITGWFGMNFPNMYIFQWKWGYPLVILLSIGLIIAEFIYFRNKKML